MDRALLSSLLNRAAHPAQGFSIVVSQGVAATFMALCDVLVCLLRRDDEVSLFNLAMEM